MTDPIFRVVGLIFRISDFDQIVIQSYWKALEFTSILINR